MHLNRHDLRGALLNLIENALDAMRPPGDADTAGGELRVHSLRRDGVLEIGVGDTGIGIEATDQERVFEPLFSTKAFGVGLGLPLVKRIVEDHQGGIGVDSEWGVGTTISVRLPLAENEQLREAG